MISLERFKALARKGQAPTGERVTKAYAATVTTADGNRTLRFIVSTASVAWNLDHCRRNPLVLWSHDTESLPIGRCTAIGVEGEALVATVEFVPPDMPVVGPLADAVYRMCCSGFLTATSVGFYVHDYDLPGDRPGLNITAAELTEFSIVTVPANRDALIDPASVPAPVVPTASVDPVEPEATATRAAPNDDARKRARRVRAARLAAIGH